MNKKLRILKIAFVAVLTMSALLAAGCSSPPEIPESIPSSPPDRDLPDRSLEALRHRVLDNAQKFHTLAASVDVVIQSPLIQGNRKKVTMEGTLYMQKPKKVKLSLYGGGKLYVNLVGNGQAYRVNMPLFGNTQYSGEYGDTIRWRPDRMHFMPDDLADILDLNDLFTGKTQVLRTYKRPPEWQIDSLLLKGEPSPSLVLAHSLRIERRTQHLIAFTKFADDSTVRMKSWFQNIQLIEAGNQTVRVPGLIYMWYPIDGTTIAIRLSDISLNTKIKPERFRL